MISTFSVSGDLLLLALMATLPVLIGIQAVAAIAGGVRRRRQVASPHGAAVRGLIKALGLHPLTISLAIEVNAQEFPILTVVRHLSEGEAYSIADWTRTVQESYVLQPKTGR